MIDLTATSVLDLLSLIIVISFTYHLVLLYEVAIFTRREDDPATPYEPPVTLLKPLTEWTEQVRLNLLSFCQQHYPDYEMIIGLPQPEAMDEARTALAAGLCNSRTRWEVCHPDLTANPKISELLALYPDARHDILILSDADIRVGPDYISQVVAPLRDPQVGAVTCLYTTPEASTLAGTVEALIINVDFIPSVLVAHHLFGSRFALGATIALRRTTLEVVGGLKALAGYLADDYQLGLRVCRAGYRIAISRHIVQNHLPRMSLSDLYRHQLRWARTIRVNQPVGWLFSCISFLTGWAALWLAASDFSEVGWRLLVMTVVFRLLEGAYLNDNLNGLQGYWRIAWLMPIKDAFYMLVWFLSFTGNRVHWAGREYVVSRDGHMVQVGPSDSSQPLHRSP